MQRPQDITIFTFAIGMIIFFSTQISACPVFDSGGKSLIGMNDPLFKLLQLRQPCPKDVIEFRKLLAEEGGEFSTTMVANRGFHNPKQGSFSFFEMVEISNPQQLAGPINKNELFFGHFTAPGENQTLTLDQNSNSPTLMIELIAWDKQSEMYNFYELVGSDQGSKWFYRGNSADVWADTARLHLSRVNGEPEFGSRMRCSGCHISGGPIMKEISLPHDSWWQIDRPLPLGGREADAQTTEIMKTLQSPTELAQQVISGLTKLMAGKAFKNKQKTSPQIALRPLFCPEEINLAASPWPLNSDTSVTHLPVGFLVDDRLINNSELHLSKNLYIASLKKLNSRFPETNKLDADHAGISPVKATSDKLAIESMIGTGIVDKEFVTDVLAVDLTRPVFSQKRCSLVQYLPAFWSNDWLSKFKKNLQESSTPEARELLSNMIDPSRNTTFHLTRAKTFTVGCQSRLETSHGVDDLVLYLGQVRSEIGASAISKNPHGQILEPGFRVIFPKFSRTPKPWQLSLDETCQLK